MQNVIDFFKNPRNIYLAVIACLILVIGVLYLNLRSSQTSSNDARIAAQNTIAELSSVVDEGSGAYSRLAQERDDLSKLLESRSETLLGIINERDERISALVTAQATIRPVRVIVRPVNVTETETIVEPTETGGEPVVRQRVDFHEIYEEFIAIDGFTLTNPAEAEIGLSFIRPVNFNVVITQAPDLSWRTYLSSDFPGMEIGAIESAINPLPRPAVERGIEDGILVGIFGGAAVTGNAGIFGAAVGYDFGPLDIEIMAGGITFPGSTDFLLAGRASLNVFDM